MATFEEFMKVAEISIKDKTCLLYTSDAADEL